MVSGRWIGRGHVRELVVGGSEKQLSLSRFWLSVGRWRTCRWVGDFVIRQL